MGYKDPAQQREYQRKWYARRRAEFFAGKCCELCGSVENLELDHRNPKTKISHNIWSWAEGRRRAEIAKCRILCKKCHDQKSKGEKALGENQGQAKLTAEQVNEIRHLCLEGELQTVVARRFEITPSNVREILTRRTWKHVA